ncbi:MAG: hypothetical protein JJV98_02845 [Desulfosarcina sp.]|nr:hypothetical protein [Desulfobacterales bacterium]
MKARDQNFANLDRRCFLAVFASMGLASTLLPGALAAASKGRDTITTEMMKQAEQIAGLEFGEREREEVIDRLNPHGFDKNGMPVGIILISESDMIVTPLNPWMDTN